MTEYEVLENKIENLVKALDKLEKEQHECETETRKRINELLEEINTNKVSIAKTSERMTMYQVFQGTLSTVLSAIAAGVSRL